MVRSIVALAVLLAAPSAWSQQESPDRLRRQTLGGAFRRANERLDAFDVNAQQLRENRNTAQGRINATRDEARAAEERSMPAMLPRVLGGW